MSGRPALGTGETMPYKAIPADQIQARWICRVGNHSIRASFPGAWAIDYALRGRSDTQDHGRNLRKENGAPDSPYEATVGPMGHETGRLGSTTATETLDRAAELGQTPPDKAQSSGFLPPELIAMIFSHVLEMEHATGRLFLWTRLVPHYTTRDNPKQTPQPMVQQYTFHSSPTVSISPYALVCKAWRDIAYDGFYGSPKNFFHFLFTPDKNHPGILYGVDEAGPHCWVQVFPPEAETTKSKGHSWVRNSNIADCENKIICSINGTQTSKLQHPREMSLYNFTHPLTSGLASWIQNVTLTIHTHRMQHAAGNEELLKLTGGLVDLLGGRETRLRRLAANLHYDDPLMEIIRIPLADNEDLDGHGNLQEEWHPRPEVVGGFEYKREVEFVAPNGSTTSRVLEPLRRLRGLVDFSVSGLVTEEFTRSMSETVRRSS